MNLCFFTENKPPNSRIDSCLFHRDIVGKVQVHDSFSMEIIASVLLFIAGDEILLCNAESSFFSVFAFMTE